MIKQYFECEKCGQRAKYECDIVHVYESHKDDEPGDNSQIMRYKIGERQFVAYYPPVDETVGRKQRYPPDYLTRHGRQSDKWYWVKINNKWFPAQKDEMAAGGWTNNDTWEDYGGQVTESFEIPNWRLYEEPSQDIREKPTFFDIGNQLPEQERCFVANHYGKMADNKEDFWWNDEYWIKKDMIKRLYDDSYEQALDALYHDAMPFLRIGGDGGMVMFPGHHIRWYDWVEY